MNSIYPLFTRGSSSIFTVKPKKNGLRSVEQQAGDGLNKHQPWWLYESVKVL